MQIRSRIVVREFKSGDRRTPSLEALNAIISIAAGHSPEFSLMHVDVSRAYFHAKAQRPVLVKLPAKDNIRRERVVPKNIRSFTTQLFQIEATRLVLVGREAMDPSFRIRGHEL